MTEHTDRIYGLGALQDLQTQDTLIDEDTGYTAANSIDRIYRVIYGGAAVLLALVGFGSLVIWSIK